MQCPETGLLYQPLMMDENEDLVKRKCAEEERRKSYFRATSPTADPSWTIERLNPGVHGK
jgi:hypothetical protein